MKKCKNCGKDKIIFSNLSNPSKDIKPDIKYYCKCDFKKSNKKLIQFKDSNISISSTDQNESLYYNNHLTFTVLLDLGKNEVKFKIDNKPFLMKSCKIVDDTFLNIKNEYFNVLISRKKQHIYN